MKSSAVGLIVVLSIVFTVLVPFESDADTISDSFSLKLTDAQGNDLSDPLFGDVTMYFDTIDIGGGVVIYKLTAMLSIKSVPANILITSTGGLFKLSVSAGGLADTFVDDTGLRFTITNGDNTYSADLTESNKYAAEFKNGANAAALDPNVSYALTTTLINGYDSPVAPESLQNVTITFQAMVADGMHQVMFISEENTIESYMAFDNYVIEKVPTISRGGYTFKGWFTPDGKEITDGYVISKNEGDIIAFAHWEKNDDNMILYLGIGGSSIAALLLLLLFLKRRKDDAES